MASMVETLRAAPYKIADERVLAVMEKLPRDLFVPEKDRAKAYGDHPLPIGHGQTISQPYIVAYMTEQLGVEPHHRVLEVGTGSGYQTAVLAPLVKHVYSVEVIPDLAEGARKVLNQLGVSNASIKIGDGGWGWPEEATFDRIIVTCAPTEIPPALVDQLAEGGRMVIPVGGTDPQELRLVEKRNGQISQKVLLPVRFVPMVRV